ncbi:MAG: hypothetical protein AAF253_12765 [Pseudomonadota bacterium]
MAGYAPLDGLAATVAAIAIILLALVSLAGTSVRRQAVEAGMARMTDLCELTGIFDPHQLQDVFGPPDMDQTWRHVRMVDIAAARRPLGHLISNDAVDGLTIAVAAASFFIRHPLVDVALVTALAAQVGGWLAASRLPR